MYGFKSISYDDLLMYHPQRNGILKRAYGASIYIFTENEHGYEDQFTEAGNKLTYAHSKFKANNTILNNLKSSEIIKVYLNDKKGKTGCWSCGNYRITEKHGWGWTLHRT